MFSSKKILISGGTGSFGKTMLKHLLATDINEIRIFSRDEKKQDDLRKEYNNSKLKFYLGDVRDYRSILNAVDGVDFIYHAAALKQVPSCEFHPMEAVKTNILGTENILEAAISCAVSRVIVLSTDKAVYPINAMGISKAMMEKVAIQKSRISSNTVICITRYGNVMASRGSVIPLFINQIKAGQPITLTDPQMTRFMMTLDESVNLVLFALKHGTPGDIFVQKSPASTIEMLVKALTDIMQAPKHSINIIGTRHGEKLYEVLLSREEMVVVEDLGNYYRVPSDRRDLNYDKFIKKGDLKISEAIEYNSHNTKRLNFTEIKALLNKISFLKPIS
jgi:UDP-N-acetylglucosamine 4,6-dehydratase